MNSFLSVYHHYITEFYFIVILFSHLDNLRQMWNLPDIFTKLASFYFYDWLLNSLPIKSVEILDSAAFHVWRQILLE